MPPPPKKRAPAKKAVTKVEDSDIEMVDSPPSKPAPKKKAVTKVESDDDFESPPSSNKGKAKAKNGSATKRKRLVSTVDDH